MLYLVILDYQSPLSVIDQYIPDHLKYLEKHYQAGHFLLSGRQEPRTGGVIMAQASHQDELMAWLAEDPFIIHEVAKARVIAWVPAMKASKIPTFIAPSAKSISNIISE